MNSGHTVTNLAVIEPGRVCVCVCERERERERESFEKILWRIMLIYTREKGEKKMVMMIFSNRVALKDVTLMAWLLSWKNLASELSKPPSMGTILVPCEFIVI